MEQNNFKCVFTDLDKTLLASGSILTDYTKETIDMLISRGIDFVPSSGRAFNSLPKELLKIQGLKYAVTSNGVSVNEIKNGKPVSTMCIPKEDIQQIIKIAQDKKICTEIFVEGQGYCSREYWSNPSIAGKNISDRKSYVQATRIPLDDYDSFVMDNIANTEAFDLIADPDIASELEKELRKKFSGVYITHSENFLIEISNIDSGKHRGMERCCRILGISPKECIAFGDASNDMEMLQMAELGIAVANATPECKSAADFVSEFTNNQDAVAKELRRIFSL
ncbi:HAD family hydrolase [Treponema sp.]|uniref:HAD family hydrolase n=1 Tax=Treponema sp. TaxID=166 RepID=UPI00298DD767|nr:HAD family hydrolase [Treponema sp.]MCQ2240849.1 HAD family hydrolase [Treponema sp.]